MAKAPGKLESSLKSEPTRHYPWSNRHLLIVISVLIATCVGVLLSTAPIAAILGPSKYALSAALHGLFGFLMLIVATISLYLAFRLFTGRINSFPDLQLVNITMALFSIITVIFGNWIYIAYRAKNPDSPRSYFIETMPAVHKIFFEFKEYTALFTVPLSVAAAFILWYYGPEILKKSWIRTAVSILIALTFFFLMIAFGLGAAVTKLKAI